MSQGPTTPVGNYPQTRMRRNRRHEWSRRMVRENALSPSDLILPIFISNEMGKSETIETMPGVFRHSIDLLSNVVGEAKSLGLPSVALFPAIPPKLKTPMAEEAYNPNNLICQAIRAIKDSHPDIGIICDVALDPFNSDGHDGIIGVRAEKPILQVGIPYWLGCI